ncbi:CPBP family intramembrane glutamic endopeptidase [Phreatobacter sp.]|uniref:CPBP family intramembrane glutamic endopeptidase n=1 Tax=Phreatobacter sp. TaxID=1966341 RepID=UPI0022C1E8CA|nr:CPBP family intramembrane glutamic endopeptidase [Phreatobacter sp.]MCZ8314862.1 CPBP family intramembrane metalloprotease [Phreatobacter sp.]
MTAHATPTPALWLRILRHPLTRLVVLGAALFFMMAISGGFMERFKGNTLTSIAVVTGMVAAAIAVYVAYARLVEGRSADELSLSGAGRELALGLLVGAGLYTASVLILMTLGIYRIEGFNPWTFLIPALVLALHSGFFEELLFRGVLFRSVEDMFGSWISLVVSSAVFGLMHLINPTATLTGAIFISIEAGLLLAAAYILTRRLWLSIGFHMAWNYTQSAVFSGIVSGGVSDPGLIRPIIRGPDLLTGGNFGLESSVIAFALCTATGIVLLVMAVRRGKIVPPPWARGG